ncbi:hypothetical protein INR75_19695 [Zunongwangia sp. SCSIO 43204]|uniref:hypothetical protein n=1 Tax=Zunongwangia sp. SCSIO 43204 TaxID=2779359 RepID=UPI001CA7F60A|nr:hypothetical protein [Zunongwangia sp. SCSIO 43204]UAB84348.1 hypothetical protein INR75_19695 [Zunongwangia sp. SCSIO 43204]
MAKIKIAELNIDASAVIKSVEDTKKKLDELVKTQKELKASGDTSSKTFVENEAKLKSLRKEYNDGIKVVQAMSGGVGKLEAELNREISTIKEAKNQNQALRRIRDEINVDTEEGQKLLKQLNDRIDQNTKLTRDNTDAISKQKSNVGNYTESINKAKVGIKAFGSALKTAGIGLAIAAFARLSNAISKNEKVMVVLNTVMNTLSAIIQPIISAVVDGAKAAYEATGGFDALGRVVSSLITLGLTPLKVAFYGVKDAIISAQLGYERLFGSDERVKELTKDLEENRAALNEVKQDAQNAGRELYTSFNEAANEIKSAYTNIAGSVSGAVKELQNQDIIGNAYDLAKFEKQIDKINAQRETIVLKYQKEAELLRQRRDDETLTMAERQKANADLIELQNEQIAKEKELINQKVEGYQNMVALNKDDTEAQVALIEARNELLDVEERVTGSLSEALTNRNSLRNEEVKQVEEAAKQKTEVELKAEEDKENRIRELKEQFRNQDKEQQELDSKEKIDKHYSDLEQEIELMIEEDTIKKDMLRTLREQWNEEISNLEAQERDKETKKLQEEVDLYAKTQQAKIDQKRKSVDQIAGLFGEETAVAKAALIAKQVLALKEWAIDNTLLKSKQAGAIAETTIDTSKGITKTAASTPFPYNIPLIAGFVAQVAGIASTIKGAFNGGSQPKFEKGGFMQIGGKRHSAGGTKFFGEDGTTFEAEQGELIGVINRNAAFMVEQLNSQYPAGGAIKMQNYLAAGGIVTRNTGSTTNISNMMNIDYNLLAELIGDQIANLKIFASIEEIRKADKNYMNIQNGAIF